MGRGQCWDTADTVSETLFVLNLISLVTLLGLSEAPKYLNVGLNMVKAYLKVLSSIPPPAQPTGANICCAPTTEVA